LLKICTGTHAGRRGSQALRPLAANPIVHRPIPRMRSDLRRDRGRRVNDDAAPFRGLCQRVRVEQIGPARLAAERPYEPISRLVSCEPDRAVAPCNELTYQATAKDAHLGRADGHGRRREVRASLRRNREFRAIAYRLWPELTPMELLGDLLSSRVLIRAAGRRVLSEEDVAAIHRPPEGDGNVSTAVGWSAADVPLLDEAAELLGEVQRRPVRGRRRRREEDDDSARDVRTVEEMARADRTWTYGHVIVDEAQEVSPMAWRMLVRRCPQRSMTVVGDWAQRSADWGARGWEGVLGAAATERLRVAELTVNYRTPEEAMHLARRLLAEIDPDLDAPSAIRSGGFAPSSSTTLTTW